ncbi:MAG TPA: divalent-cation tolerance protein CutA [Opitutaceae bacterium]|nr:divalent-cation tolerance protein CutA [Opitutaceae bacterium]
MPRKETQNTRRLRTRPNRTLAKNYSIVITTFSKERTGSRITKALLSARAAACIQVLPIRSFYPWKGRISRDRENLMLIKAKAGDFGRIKRLILRNHDYEVPEIISVRVDRGLARYFAWIDEVTA